MNAVFLEKMPAATYPQVRAFQTYKCYFSEQTKSACGPAATYPQVEVGGFQKSGGSFYWEKKRLRQRTHKLKAPEKKYKKKLRQRTHKLKVSKYIGAIFFRKKNTKTFFRKQVTKKKLRKIFFEKNFSSVGCLSSV